MNVAAARNSQPASYSKGPVKFSGTPKTEEVRDQFLRNYDEQMASFQQTGIFNAKYDSEPAQQQALRSALQGVLAGLPGISAASIAQTAIRCLEEFAKDPHPSPDEESYSLAHGSAPNQAVRLAALSTIEALSVQKGDHPHVQTLSQFGRELSQELQPKAWTPEKYNLDNQYACDYAGSVAQKTIEELATQDATKFNPALSESVGKVILTSDIYGNEQQILALDKAFHLINEDRNPLVYEQVFDRSKAYSGESIDITRSHSWIPFLKETDVNATTTAKTAVMRDILRDHGVEIKHPFHSYQ